MALPIGFLLFVLGCVAMFAWSAEALAFLKGAVPFGLIVWGSIALLVGYSERKARREFDKAMQDGPGEAAPVENGENTTEAASVS